MFQRRARDCAQQIFRLAVLIGTVAGCEPGAEQAPATSPTREKPRVVSLVPAATDLLIGMGCADQLAGVSNWDFPRAELQDLPRVGDYRTIDWEKISQIRPEVMIVQFRQDKMPPGLAERAATNGITLVNVKINRLDDVFATLGQLGDAIGQPQNASAAERQLRSEIETVRARVEGRPRPRTLLTRTESTLAVVGGGNFLDDILDIAGGMNVIEGGDNSYPTIDRERLVALDPQVVLNLLPGATEQELARAREFWEGLSQLSAVKSGRVYFLTGPYLLLPGYSVGKIAQDFAARLHPQTSAGSRP